MKKRKQKIVQADSPDGKRAGEALVEEERYLTNLKNLPELPFDW